MEVLKSIVTEWPQKAGSEAKSFGFSGPDFDGNKLA